MQLKPFEIPSPGYQSDLIEIAKIQNDALMEIIRCEATIEGGCKQRKIAEEVLVEVFKISKKVEDQIGQN